MLEIGTIIDGKYKILNQIGQGGMSTVYLAMNERANKQWAIKEVRKAGVLQSEVVYQSLIVEIEMLKKLKNPYLPSIVDVIENDGSYLIVMDYIEGNTLLDILEDYGPQPQEQVMEWGRQLCEVLGYLHSQNPPIIYRDLKPANVMLRPNGKIALIDFGTAREYKEENIQDTTCLGTHGYAAPEQFGGQGQTDARTDIYCLGTTLYHLLTGHNPCMPPYELQPIRNIIPEASEGIEEIIKKCTRPNPKERFQSCEELLYALKHYEEYDAKYKKVQRQRLAYFLISLSLTLVFIGGAFYAKEKSGKVSYNQYEDFLVQAVNLPQSAEQEKIYQLAIQLQPQNEKAYIELLRNVYLADDIFSADEDTMFRTLLISEWNGKTYEEWLKENKRGYGRFAYQMGLAYFYYYEDTGNKAMAVKWFEAALASGELDEQQMVRTECLSRISSYYTKLGKINKSGDPVADYVEYWEDLRASIEGNLVEEDNATTALVVYRETVTQIYNNSVAFKKAGIAQKEVRSLMKDIQRHLSEDFYKEELTSEGRLGELYQQILEEFVYADEVLTNTYGGENE